MDVILDIKSKRTRIFLEALLPSMLDQLKLATSKKQVLITTMPDCHEDGLTIQIPNSDTIMIVMNSRTKLMQLGLTLAHELVHVAQMARGLLKPAKRGGNIWAGKYYPKSTPYLDRPWEVQAFSKQELLLRKALG